MKAGGGGGGHMGVQRETQPAHACLLDLHNHRDAVRHRNGLHYAVTIMRCSAGDASVRFQPFVPHFHTEHALPGSLEQEVSADMAV